ncbi:MAG: glycoside hydrolase family 25 protein [Coriobacteriia bacterium]|nr:glycoside hydrolase family 25 protein [Coriobacteriia bacterium]
MSQFADTETKAQQGKLAYRVFCAILAFVLVVAFTPMVPATAQADEADATQSAQASDSGDSAGDVTPTATQEDVSVASSESSDTANSWRFTNGKLTQDTTLEKTMNGLKVYGTGSSKGSIGKLIDVSKWDGKINWSKVKAAGIDYAIIRCGYGENKTSQDDAYFSYNVRQARAAGVKIGVYIYSYGYNTTKAESEADHVLRLLKAEGLTPAKLALPVYYDLEEQAGTSKPCVKVSGTKKYVSNAMLGKMAAAFAAKITKAGYKMGVYANKSWWTSYLTVSQFNNASWSKWVAQYYYASGKLCSYKGNYDIWQYSSTGRVNGISTYVDMNYLYKNFDSSILTASIDPSKVSVPSKVMTDYDFDGALSGTLTSTAKMKSIKVRLKQCGTTVKEATVSVGATSYNFANFDTSKIKVDLTAGASYSIEVLVTVEDTEKSIFTKEFSVTDDAKLFTQSVANASVKKCSLVEVGGDAVLLDYKRPTFGTSSMSLPTSITKGTNFTFKGKVTSSVTMNKVAVTLVSKTTGKTLYSWSGNVNTKSYTLPSAVTSHLNVKGLAMGKYKLTITGYSSTASGAAASRTFTIGPKASSKVKLSKGKKKFTVKLKKVSGAKGYQIRYSLKKSFATDYFKTTTKTSKAIKTKKSKKYYYVQVRSYKVVKGVKCYGSWSSVKKVKTK